METGAGARERLLGQLGSDAVVAETLDDLAKISADAD